MDIQIKKLSNLAKIPEKGSAGAAGYDLSSIESGWLRPGERKLFKTGIAIKIPEGYYGRIAPRSGLALKQGIDVMAGVIDSDYIGEVGVILINLANGDETESVSIKEGQKIAQLIIELYEDAEFEEVSDLSDTKRGENGFGSSDKVEPQEEIPQGAIKRIGTI